MLVPACVMGVVWCVKDETGGAECEAWAELDCMCQGGDGCVDVALALDTLGRVGNRTRHVQARRPMDAQREALPHARGAVGAMARLWYTVLGSISSPYTAVTSPTYTVKQGGAWGVSCLACTRPFLERFRRRLCPSPTLLDASQGPHLKASSQGTGLV